MAELWDLYDKDRNPLHRTHQRGLPLAPGEYHMAVIVVIVNRKGEVLLTRRAKEKDLCPGWWENTGGSVLAGETSLEAILRELREETGIRARPEELTLLLQENCRTDTHFDIYALTWEGEAADIRFQPGETDAARWLPRKDWEQVAGTQGTLCPARRPAYRQELFRRLERYCQGWREFPPMEGPAPELWDLYDKDRNPLGRTVERGAPLPPGAYHLAVQIVPLDSSGQVLLTRRADSKPKYPGFWEVPGGCAKAGEDSPTAACRELLEETGIPAQPEELTLLSQLLLPTAHLDVYAVTKDVPLSRLTLQPGETGAAQYLPLEEWLAKVGSGNYLSPSWFPALDAPHLPKLRQYLAGKRDFTT